MAIKNPLVDAYIAKSAAFAIPILNHLRKTVHSACPEVEEKIKWSFPFFEYKGSLCHMAAFKSHCAFGFWKAALMKDKSLLATAREEKGMGHLGKITSVKDLPAPSRLKALIKQAMAVNEAGVKAAKAKKSSPLKPALPAYFTAALKKNKTAWTRFQQFPPGQQKEYILWITGAKTDATRLNRLQTAVEWIAEGKRRNWKYESKV